MSDECWEPVEDGFVFEDRDRRIHAYNEEIEMNNWEHKIWILLPDDLRLCRRVEVERPRPEWSQAPAWANWWTVDANGTVLWHEQEPVRSSNAPLWHSAGHTNWSDRQYSRRGRRRQNVRDNLQSEQIEIPLGVDWRELVERRPEAKDE